MEIKCAFCGSTEHEVFTTYKSDWIICLQCHNAIRQLKNRLFWESGFPGLLFKMISPVLRKTFPKAIELLLHDKGATSASATYDYYGNVDEKLYERGGWKAVDDHFLQLLDSLKLNIADKTVLTLSDGPGFFSERIKARVRQIITTEFDEFSCDEIRRKRGIEVRKFDSNQDRLEVMFPGERFDFIFFRSGIEYTKNIQSLFSSFAEIMHDDSIGIIMTHPPSAGVFLEFMFMDYMLFNLYNPETIVRLLVENGLELIVPYGPLSKSYDARMKYRKPNLILNMMRRLFQIIYRIRASQSCVICPLTYTITEHYFVFRKKAKT